MLRNGVAGVADRDHRTLRNGGAEGWGTGREGLRNGITGRRGTGAPRVAERDHRAPLIEARRDAEPGRRLRGTVAVGSGTGVAGVAGRGGRPGWTGAAGGPGRGTSAWGTGGVGVRCGGVGRGGHGAAGVRKAVCRVFRTGGVRSVRGRSRARPESARGAGTPSGDRRHGRDC
ncbi:hypothetical protein Saso_28560 [Streptomyces asoensis]|uniref:Uncharacterized protein n=1 Tax=Streptomyces asoensis TaxID=249586 RepID=A0ABQ3RZA5_9ACTN|nr:hypothetical protein GCM10010496_10140 [Streptomyces asoensis]GHI61206.1 hypothetical protein Saso_28560 [Streptomyces asoensis]